MTALDVGIGGYQLPAQKVVAAQKLTGAFANQILSMRYVMSLFESRAVMNAYSSSGILGVGRGVSYSQQIRY